MKKYTVVWNEVYCCSKEVEAESEGEAIAKCQHNPDHDQKLFGSYEDWGAFENKEQDND